MINRIIFILSLIISSNALSQEDSNQEPVNTKLDGYQIKANKIHPSRFYDKAVIQALNKTTAKTSNIEMHIGEKITFGQLSIIAHRCWQAPLSEKPESKILLEIFENKEVEGEMIEERIFYGWMFASSPSVSNIEHPIYDITAITCKN